jgi:Na+-translocating membrane potential-generating system (MpsC)
MHRSRKQGDLSPAAIMALNERSRPGELSAALSNAIVALFAEYTGRGATQSRTYVHENLIVCVLHDSMTKGERSLVRDGKEEAVLAIRRTYQESMRTEPVTSRRSRHRPSERGPLVAGGDPDPHAHRTRRRATATSAKTSARISPTQTQRTLAGSGL